MVSFYCFVTKACARKPCTAASVERRRRERRTLLAGAAGELAGATRLRQARPSSACTFSAALSFSCSTEDKYTEVECVHALKGLALPRTSHCGEITPGGSRRCVPRLLLVLFRSLCCHKNPLHSVFTPKLSISSSCVHAGLVGHYTPEQMTGRLVIVAANLKPRPLAGIESNGMVICASNADHTAVELLVPPEGCAPGERVSFAGHAGEPAQPNQMQKKKYLEDVLPVWSAYSYGCMCACACICVYCVIFVTHSD